MHVTMNFGQQKPVQKPLRYTIKQTCLHRPKSHRMQPRSMTISVSYNLLEGANYALITFLSDVNVLCVTFGAWRIRISKVHTISKLPHFDDSRHTIFALTMILRFQTCTARYDPPDLSLVRPSSLFALQIINEIICTHNLHAT